VRSGGGGQTTLHDTGQRLDGTGLLYYHARYYDPGLGRFLSADTLVPGADALTMGGGAAQGAAQNPQDLNRYAYGLNNPVKNTDPTGHCPMCIGALIGGGIDLGAQLWMNGGDLQKVNWVEVGVSAVVGATGVGVGAAIANAAKAVAVAAIANGASTAVASATSVTVSVATNAAASAAVSAAGAEVQNRVQELVTPGQFAPVDVRRAAAFGGALGAAGAALPAGAEKAVGGLRQLRGEAAARKLTIGQLGRLSSIVEYGRRGPTIDDFFIGAANALGIAAANTGPIVDPLVLRRSQ
jgi:RHS repeat-associated protein